MLQLVLQGILINQIFHEIQQLRPELGNVMGDQHEFIDAEMFADVAEKNLKYSRQMPFIKTGVRIIGNSFQALHQLLEDIINAFVQQMGFAGVVKIKCPSVQSGSLGDVLYGDGIEGVII